MPFDGAISAFLRTDAPGRGDVPNPAFRFCELLAKRRYQRDPQKPQIERVTLRHWTKVTGTRIAILVGARATPPARVARSTASAPISDPRGARVVALPKPSDIAATQWYFQRDINPLPASGAIVFRDRSRDNLAVVEHDFDVCTPDARDHAFAKLPDFVRMPGHEGIVLFRFRRDIGRAEQLRRWAAYSTAIGATVTRNHPCHAPRPVLRSEDKRRARRAAIRQLLAAMRHTRRTPAALGDRDGSIAAGPEIRTG